MAISRVGGASNTAINAGAVTVTLPGGMQVDDLILFAWSCGDDDFTQPTLAPTTFGYNEIVTSGTLSADGGTAGDGNLAIYYKFHNGTDTTFQTGASGTGTDSSNAVACIVFRGVATVAQGGPLETSATATGTTGGDPDPPEISGFDEATGVVVIAGACSSSSSPFPSPPANYVTNAETIEAPAETFRAGVSLAFREDPSDPENPGAFSSLASGAWCAATMVLKAAPEAAPPSRIWPRRTLVNLDAVNRGNRW